MENASDTFDMTSTPYAVQVTFATRNGFKTSMSWTRKQTSSRGSDFDRRHQCRPLPPRRQHHTVQPSVSARGFALLSAGEVQFQPPLVSLWFRLPAAVFHPKLQAPPEPQSRESPRSREFPARTARTRILGFPSPKLECAKLRAFPRRQTRKVVGDRKA